MDSMYIDQKKKIEARGKRKRCLVIGIAVVFAFFLLVLILGLTVFKAQHPITTVNSVKLRGFRAGIDPRRLAVDLNVTLDLNLSVMNPNKVSFEYQNSSSFLYYKRVLVGEADIPAGEILAGGTAGIQSTLTIMTDRLITNSGIYSDVISGEFPVSTSTVIAGTVKILSFGIHVVSYTNCDVVIDVFSSGSVKKLECNYKTKF